VRQGRRDLLLTTLIDLLVQLVFVFIIIMIVRATVQNPKRPVGDGGYLLSKAWQKLVEAHGLQNAEPMQAAQTLLEESERQKLRAEEQERALDEARRQIASLKRSDGRAPGKPICLDGQRVMVAIRFTFNTDGTVTATSLRDWQIVRSWIDAGTNAGAGTSASLSASSNSFGSPLSPSEFDRIFGALARSVRKTNDCTLQVEYSLAAGILGEVSDQSIRLVAKHFRPRRMGTTP